jgi:hypothetical protein
MPGMTVSEHEQVNASSTRTGVGPRFWRRARGCTLLVGVLLAACSDRVRPAPSELPGTTLKLPPSTTNFFEHHSGGVPFSMLQFRFDFAAKDLAGFASGLPCSFGPLETGAPTFATVGTNTRDWYNPEKAVKHRGCEGMLSSWSFSALVDVSSASVHTAYVVLSD